MQDKANLQRFRRVGFFAQFLNFFYIYLRGFFKQKPTIRERNLRRCYAGWRRGPFYYAEI